ncbi:S41 family peptidase [Vibrio sp. CAU 1672]|uniref:S41 family peptidase n=1 Tax=Vibrio sp. CAU 1672 TaxID=3032594 RepID=UPI0023D9B2A7|nr:S41 family peptidase [Vibrio sp. CAU 1672]MDF2153556.1 S41 family peptidase [Vibrio sp. CAU 1672]
MILPWLENGIVYLSLNSFVDRIILDEFYSIYSNLKQVKGIIIDLRFNGGGNSGIGTEILSNFTNQNL